MLNVKLEVFEGPFDLLFKLIEKHKIDIYDIPIALIAEEYCAEVEKMEKKDIDNIGEFLIMAATLLKIKSKMLLPDDEQDEDVEDPRLELVERLLEYKKFKDVCDTLRQMEEDSSEIAFKGNQKLLEDFKNEIDYDSFLEGADMNVLTQAFLKIMKQEHKEKEKPNDDDARRHITDTVRKRRVYTVEMQMSIIYDRLMNLDNVKFSELFSEEQDKMEKVMTFLALLEMIKMKKLKCSQDEIFGEITIEKADDFESGLEFNDDEISIDRVENPDEVKEEQEEQEEVKEDNNDTNNEE